MSMNMNMSVTNMKTAMTNLACRYHQFLHVMRQALKAIEVGTLKTGSSMQSSTGVRRPFWGQRLLDSK